MQALGFFLLLHWALQSAIVLPGIMSYTLVSTITKTIIVATTPAKKVAGNLLLSTFGFNISLLFADKQVATVANELWGKIDEKTTKINRYGKGLVINGIDMQQAFDLIKVIPDAKITGSDSILFIHRKLTGGEAYFISNQKNTTVNINAAFRLTGKQPELWNAISGSVRNLPAFRQTATTTSVPLTLAPFESAFVIFRKDAVRGSSNRPNFPAAKRAIDITGPWIVNFDSKMRGPAKPVVFDGLTDWIDNANDSIKYYSGTAVYNNAFRLNKKAKGDTYRLDLGDARAIAKVTVNGIDVGGAWTPPYRVDITKAIKPGLNKLKIKVVNTWVNRLVGDSKLPVAERKTSALILPNLQNGLESSGLLGPVKVDVMKY
ncbi:MAG: glycosylhydrolase-like jelly roll fold domain-containing protein [Mucilaginibacter sp.]